MKTLNVLRLNPRLTIKQIGIDGGNGTVTLPTWQGSVIFSNGCGWEHVSVAPYKHNITPSWDDMCLIKEMFFEDNEAVIQIHPPKDEYVNNMPNCLHLWRYIGEMTLPPSWMVGIKKGQSKEEYMKEIEEALKGDKNIGDQDSENRPT